MIILPYIIGISYIINNYMILKKKIYINNNTIISKYYLLL